jgi:unsaturated chondroitin disaccharide hydrolase
MNISQITEDEVQRALAACVVQVKSNIPEYTNKSQNHSSVNGHYPACENTQWTCGFWPGELWLAYEATHESVFRDTALVHVQSMKNRITKKIEVDHHDMGFLYSPACVAAWKLVNNKDARTAALLAADQLISRFQPKGQFIQAWGAMGEPKNYRYIIDCLLNTPLLYWASRETDNQKYAAIARAHTHTCMNNSIRPDGSTYHTFFMDINTGNPLRGATCQGYSDDSVWARGQSWGVYGSALAYRYDPQPAYLESFHRTLNFFLSKLPADSIPYWDMIFTDSNAVHDGETEPRDSSSASIVCCGMLDMASQLKKNNASKYSAEIEKYMQTSRSILKSLADNYAVKDSTKANGLVLHGTYSKKSPYNTCTPEGVDECVSWGDYFYMEALTRLNNPSWDLYW